MTLPKPDYERGSVRLWLADCLDILPQFEPGSIHAVVTDPPYPSYLTKEYGFNSKTIHVLELFPCRQFVFWTPSESFPLTYSGKRIWDKCVGTNTQFEEIYERNNASGYKIHKAYSMGCFSSVSAQMTGETITGHKSQKPLKLILGLIAELDAKTILDPFMGSGTTGVACVRTGRAFLGIEKEPKYFEIACRRIDEAFDKLALIDHTPPAKRRQAELNLGTEVAGVSRAETGGKL